MASKTTAVTSSSSSDRLQRPSITNRPQRPPDCPTPAPGGIRGPNPPRAKRTKVVAKVINNRGKNYSDWETNIMLDCVEEILPHGGDMWNRCSEMYLGRIGEGYEVRDGDSLRTKFKSL